MLKIGWKACPYCGDDEVYRSRRAPLTWLDRFCELFLLRLVRCHECENRHYRPVFFPVPEYPHAVSTIKPGSQTEDGDERRERSA
jgi:hypothetical protein